MCDFLSGRQREKTVITEERGHPTIQLLCILVVGMTSLISSPKCRDAKTSNPLLSDPTDWPEGNGLLPLSYRPTTLRFWCPPFPYSTCMENSSWFSTLCTLPHPKPTWALPQNLFIRYLLSALCAGHCGRFQV